MYDEDLESVIVSDKRMAQHSPILVLVKCPFLDLRSVIHSRQSNIINCGVSE